MSHHIEFSKGAFRVTLPKGDERFPSYAGPHWLLFALRGCDNNVVPHEPRWEAFDLASGQIWRERPMLPASVWRLARDADGGGIMPGGRVCTGTAYIKQWQEAVQGAQEFTAAVGMNRVKIWAASEDESWPRPPLSLAAVHDLPSSSDAWGRYAHLRGSLHAAFHTLFPSRPFPDGCSNVNRPLYPGTPQFWDALHLFENRKHLPFGVHLLE